MKPQKILGKLPDNYPIEYSQENYLLAQKFVMNKWLERFNERKQKWENSFGGDYPDAAPQDLSYSCKFSSLFAGAVFNASIKGNYEHQYCFKDNIIIDLNKDAHDVQALKNPYIHDLVFFESRDHIESMKFCKARVNMWIQEFPAYLMASKLKNKTSRAKL